MSDELPKAMVEFSLPELTYLAAFLDYKRAEPHWAPSYLEFITTVGLRIEAEINRIETPYKEAEILRQADEIRAKRRANAP